MSEKHNKMPAPPAQENPEGARAQRLANLAELKQHFGDPFHVTKFDKKNSAAELQERFKSLVNGEKSDFTASIAGRVMANRNSGMFIDLLDDSGRIQVFHNIKELDEKTKTLLKLIDLGDIIGVVGMVRRTPRGEL